MEFMGLKKRLYFLIVTSFLVVATGSLGYYLIFTGHYPYIDCLYMTIISLTSVGYGEILPVSGNVPAQIFTMLLITVGLGIILYGISSLAALFIEGEITGFMRKNKMRNEISKLRDHYIVCGGGETGYPLIVELVKNREQVVLIECDDEKIEKCRAIEEVFYIRGDATDDANLAAAGIEHARGILIALPSDKDSLYVTMSARMLNRSIRIISRVANPELEPKLKKAGADRVVSPNFIGALRMASEMLRPAAVDFIDRMLRDKTSDLRIHELPVTARSTIRGIRVNDPKLADRLGFLVLGARNANGVLALNPGSSEVIEEGMTLIVMGEVGRIAQAKAQM